MQVQLSGWEMQVLATTDTLKRTVITNAITVREAIIQDGTAKTKAPCLPIISALQA